MALLRFSIKHRSKSQGTTPGASHTRYMLRVPEGAAASHAEYVIRSRSSVADREDLRATGTGNLPDWAGGDPVVFFTAADTYERMNGRVCTQIEAALPRELSLDQQKAVVQDFVDGQLGTSHAYVWAIHETTARDGQPHPHVHIAFSERRDEGQGFAPEQYFARNGCTKDRTFNAYGYAERSRVAWSDTLNLHLEATGSDARVDPRTYKAQGIDREPTSCLSPKDVSGAKYHGRESKDWQAVTQQRDAQTPQNMTQLQAYWEQRKQALGITPGMAHADQLDRITSASRQAHVSTPRHPSLTLEQITQQQAQLTAQLARQQQQVQRVEGAIAQERERIAEGRPHTPAGLANIRRLVEEEQAVRHSRLTPDLDPSRVRRRGMGW